MCQMLTMRQEYIELNGEIHDVELAIQRGRDAHEKQSRGGGRKKEEDPVGGLELMLKTVGRDVSSKTAEGEGGLLSKVKAFNAFLERTAGELEAKA